MVNQICANCQKLITEEMPICIECYKAAEKRIKNLEEEISYLQNRIQELENKL